MSAVATKVIIAGLWWVLLYCTPSSLLSSYQRFSFFCLILVTGYIFFIIFFRYLLRIRIQVTTHWGFLVYSDPLLRKVRIQTLGCNQVRRSFDTSSRLHLLNHATLLSDLSELFPSSFKKPHFFSIPAPTAAYMHHNTSHIDITPCPRQVAFSASGLYLPDFSVSSTLALRLALCVCSPPQLPLGCSFHSM